MYTFRRSIVVLASAGLLAVASAPAFAISNCDAIADNVLLNCGFEYGNFGTPWTVTDSSGFTGVDPHSPHSGINAASLGATGTIGTLSQTATTVSGSYYALSFFLDNLIATDPSGTPYPGNNFFSVSVTNASNQSTTLFSQNNLPETGAFVAYEYFFFGTGSETIKFSFENDPSYFSLDDVILQDPPAPTSGNTPEPSSLILMGTGALALGGAVRRKSSKSPLQAAL